ncbi:hypothetical protein [Ralstonia pseudosolanacearum]
MATNDFLPFAGGAGANVITQAVYAALAAQQTGFQSGVASSAQLNKVWRQSSIMGAVLAQFTANFSGQNSVDDGTTATLLANLQTALNAAGITAGLTDNSTNLATTAWVSRLGLAFSPAAGVSFAANTTLTVSQLGGWGDIQAAGLTVTLPLATTCRIGSTFTLRGGAYGGTLKGSGTDAIISATGTSANTLSLLQNEIATVECNGTTWFVTMGGVGPMTTGRLLNVQIFTASGTYTPTAGTKSVLVEGCGAGGAGGGVPIASGTVAAAGGGGSAGSFGKKRILSGFAGVAVTVGAAGVGAANAAGTAGGTSSFGSLVTFPGGGGGAVGTATSTASVNAIGGTQSNAPTSADIASPGWTGKPGINLGGASAFSGSGGDSPYGVAGGYAGANATYVQNGTAALGFGAGGGGAVGSNSGTTAAGGNGSAGLIIVWEYA